MNNIYKVIWSKAKNCYVVASEIARSHTKSASGSEKIGGVARHALLALGSACAIACGGFVNVGAVEYEHVDVQTTGTTTATVYTKNGTESYVDHALANFDTKTQVNEKIEALKTGDVTTNKNNIADLQTTTTEHGLKITANTTQIANNTAAIEKKIDTVTADARYATRTELIAKADATALDTKADKTYVDTELTKKADKDTVTALDGRVGVVEGKVTTLEGTVGDASRGLVKDVADLKTQGTTLTNALGNKADQSDLDAAKAKITANEGNITALQNKTAKLSPDGTALNGMNTVETGALKVTGGISNGTGVTTTLTDIDNSMKQTDTNKADIVNLKTTTGKQDTAIKDLQKKTTNISYDDGAGTSIDGITVKDGNIVGNGNSAITGLTNVETGSIKTGSINGKSLTGTNVATEKNVADAVKTETDARTEADKALGEKITKNSQDIATLNGKVATAEGNITDLKAKDTDLEKKIQTNADNIQTNKNDITTIKQRTAGIDRIDATNGTTIEGNVTVNSLGNVTAEGDVTAKGKLIGDGVDAGSLNVENASHLKGDVTMGNKLTVTGDTTLQKTDVDGALTVTGESSLKNTTVGGTLNVTGETTLNGKLTAKGEAKFTENVTVEKDLTVNGKLNVDKISMKNDELKNGKKHDSATTITADEISNLAKVTEQGNTTESQFTHNEKGTFNYAKDEKSTNEWKRATSNVTADGVSNKMTDSDGNTHTYYQTAAETKEQLVNGNKSNFEKKTAEGNTISIKDKDADGNKKSLTNKQTVDGEKTSVTNKDSSSTVNQGADQIRNYVASTDGTKSSTEVKADGITNTSDGTITNDANHIENKANTMDTTVTGKATENYGELETTVNGNQTTTVTGNVKEDYKKDLTTTVGGNELHEVTGTKTENVTGKVTENYNGGQETNVKGNQDIKVSGTQTTTATDIKRNASSGMIDTIDNDYGTNTETKVAGKTTTDVSIKGTEEKGQYIRGANESRDYLIKGTLKNSETKTVDATSTEITDGTNKASTIQKVTDVAGSVTNGTETGVSGIHANDDGSVSIDSAVSGEGGSSVINQKKDSITSAVGNADGSISTVIRQDKDNVTIASSNGAVAIVGKDIVSNAQETITNTAGTSITNQVKDSKVTTDANGTTFENNTPAVSDGGATTTKINGNQITTGRVNANELAVSDKDDQGNTADFSVKAGEGIKGSATDKDGNKTYTKVTATENSFQVQDKDGNIKNHQVNTKDKSENTIKNGDKTNTVTSTADGTTFNNSKANTAFEGGTYTDTTINGNTITTGKVTMDYADVMKDLSVRGNATIKGDVTAKSYKVGDKTYISAAGINANDQKITNVADGSISEGSKDAVNGGQLYTVKNDLEGKVNKVGANAAAMANLHPMEFDPDSKWNIAAAIGNYGSETAAALGAFYRPNDDVMVNLSTAFGTGENMVGGGVSVRLGKGGNKLSREESNALKDQVNDLTARMDALLSVLNPNMSKDFPDVPENHWAYEAVSRLAGNDIVQGYPDGEFHGERTMTRYEMAEIIYNALSRGAEAEKELVEEFKPELQAMAASEKATAEKAEG